MKTTTCGAWFKKRNWSKLGYLCTIMALTPSQMIPLGTSAPDFLLLQPADSQSYSLQQLRGSKATLIMFICNHCPYVKHIIPQLIELSNDYQPKGVSFIGISSNDARAYPEDHPDEIRRISVQEKYPFHYLYDETQETAKAYDASCTPDFFLFDDQLKLVYRGQLDNSRPGNQVPCTGESLRTALDNLLAGSLPDKEQRPSLGCNIKWK